MVDKYIATVVKPINIDTSVYQINIPTFEMPTFEMPTFEMPTFETISIPKISDEIIGKTYETIIPTEKTDITNSITPIPAVKTDLISIAVEIDEDLGINEPDYTKVMVDIPEPIGYIEYTEIGNPVDIDPIGYTEVESFELDTHPFIDVNTKPFEVAPFIDVNTKSSEVAIHPFIDVNTKPSELVIHPFIDVNTALKYTSHVMSDYRHVMNEVRKQTKIIRKRVAEKRIEIQNQINAIRTEVARMMEEATARRQAIQSEIEEMRRMTAILMERSLNLRIKNMAEIKAMQEGMRARMKVSIDNIKSLSLNATVKVIDINNNILVEIPFIGLNPDETIDIDVDFIVPPEIDGVSPIRVQVFEEFEEV